MKKVIKLVLVSIFGLTQSFGQGTPLSIGDKAPALSYSKWIQGSPIKNFNTDKVYVLEFWATWCGPCVKAMPHLSELAEKYKNTHIFIGCNILENTNSLPYESVLPRVTTFVENKSKEGKLTYNVIVDNNSTDMLKNWMEAADLRGIPSTFVISNGKIAWIGHPYDLEPVLISLINGTYNAEKFKAEKQKEIENEIAYQKKLENLRKTYLDFEAKQDYNNAIRYTDSAMVAIPQYQLMFMQDKFRMIIDHFGDDKAIEFGNKVLEEKQAIGPMAEVLYKKDNLSPKMKEYAIEFSKHMRQDIPQTIVVTAEFQARAGHFKDAALTQQKAIELAEKLKLDVNHSNDINDKLINAYKTTLIEYKNHF